MSINIESHSIRVQPGPGNYYSYPGPIDELEKIYSDDVLKDALWLSGQRAENAVIPYLPNFYQLKDTQKYRFKGHCTHEFVDNLAASARLETTLVIGIGGGSVLDTAKALASKLNLPFVAIPTIAATCAAITPLSVWYNVDGKALGYEIFKNAAELVLVEPEVILNAPSKYLKAGLADTLAKWYEADIICSGYETLPLAARIGLDISATLRDTLLLNGEDAFEAVTKNEINSHFLEVIDAILIGGGAVGGFGEKFTRIAAAHAIHNGLSVLQEAHSQLHGIKVAYGILVQSALLGKEDELQELAVKFKTLGLPTSLADLEIPNTTENIDNFVEATIIPSESIHLLPFPINSGVVKDAIALVENVANKIGGRVYA